MRLTMAALAALALTAFPLGAPAQIVRPAANGNETTLVITAQGVVSRPPDTATINTGIVTNDDVAQTATSRNNEIYQAVQSRLAALGIDGSKVKSVYYNVSFNPRPTPAPARPGPEVYPAAQRFGYVVNRSLTISVPNVAQTGAVVDTLVAAGVTSVGGVSYGLANRKTAADESVAAAMADASSQAQAVANAAHMRIVGIKQIQVGNNYGGPIPVPAPVPMGTIARATSLPPGDVDVRTNVTVTYLLRP